jgi:hypothetical protein
MKRLVVLLAIMAIATFIVSPTLILANGTGGVFTDDATAYVVGETTATATLNGHGSFPTYPEYCYDRGFVWDTVSHESFLDYANIWIESNDDGWSGNFSFSYQVTDLDPEGIYYFRAIANDDYAYHEAPSGEWLQGIEMTVPHLIIQTDAATDVTDTSATLNGDILDTLGSDCSERGFEYGLTSSYGSSWIESGTYSEGAYDSGGNVTGLLSNTAYHFRAVALNANGWGYGVDKVLFASSGGGVEPPLVALPLFPGKTMALDWLPIVGSEKTMVRYSTDDYPSDPTGGDGSIQAYFDNGVSYKVTGLTSGTLYYFTAWGYVSTDGADYYSDPIGQVEMSTYPDPTSTWQGTPVDPGAIEPGTTKISGAPGFAMGAWVAGQMHFDVSTWYMLMGLLGVCFLVALTASTTKSVALTIGVTVILLATLTGMGIFPKLIVEVIAVIGVAIGLIKGVQTYA